MINTRQFFPKNQLISVCHTFGFEKGGFEVCFRPFNASSGDTDFYPSLCLFQSHRGQASKAENALKELHMVSRDNKRIFS